MLEEEGGEISCALYSEKMEGEEGIYVVELLFIRRQRTISYLGEGNSSR